MCTCSSPRLQVLFLCLTCWGSLLWRGHLGQVPGRGVRLGPHFSMKTEGPSALRCFLRQGPMALRWVLTAVSELPSRWRPTPGSLLP